MLLNKFTIFPAIHLRNGEVLRFDSGDTATAKDVPTDPVACARQWIEQGAEWLQLVNLDAAFDNDLDSNRETIARICALGARIQYGGGIRSLEDVDRAIGSGVERVMIGTAAVENPQLVAQAIASHGSEAVVLAIDADASGEVHTHGWRSRGSVQAAALAIQMRQLGVTTAVHTSIQQDGSMTGADLESSTELARVSGLQIIVGGGIASMKDLQACFNRDGIDGVIVGKALHSGALDLRQALQVTRRKESFEAALPSWKQDQQQVWNRFGYELIEHNLKKHIPVDSPPLRILDAGGGNGLDSLRLARMNHRVELVDISRQMLDDARASAALAGVGDRLHTRAIDILDIPEYYDRDTFDIVLCHNVIQFVDDVNSRLQGLADVLKPGGFISLVSTNQYSLPYQAAFLEQDLDKAFASLEIVDQYNPVFDLDAHEYRPDEIIDRLDSMGFTLEKHYGIRCLFNYWGTNELKEDSEVYEKLRKLEYELTERYPYLLTARQFQLILRKN